VTAPKKIPPVPPSTTPGIVVTGSKQFSKAFTAPEIKPPVFHVGDRVRERQCWAYSHNYDMPERWPEDSTRRGEVVNVGKTYVMKPVRLIDAIWVLWDGDDEPERETDLGNIVVLSPIDEIARLADEDR